MSKEIGSDSLAPFVGVNVGEAIYRLLLIHELVPHIPGHKILVAGNNVTVRIYEKYRSYTTERNA